MRPTDLVITGVGAVCHLGAELPGILAHLKAGTAPDLDVSQEAVDLGCRCTRYGRVHADLSDEALRISRREGRFMGRSSRLALHAARQALADAGREGDDLAVLFGAGSGDTAAHVDIQARLERTGTARRVKPTMVPRLMGSTVSANLVNVLRTRGPSASVLAACAGGAWNLITAAMLVQSGLCRAALAGGVESLDMHFHAGFDTMRAYCADADGTLQNASRPYAADRGGFIFGEGAGALVLERRDHAEARGARILAVLRGWGLSSDGDGEMVQPSADGAARAMRQALEVAGVAAEDIAYVNAHATSTPAGDVEEARAIHEVLGSDVLYGSTKGSTGHGVSAAGALEAIFTACMLDQGFIAPSRNATPVDPALEAHPPVTTLRDMPGRFAMSNSFGFGGTNASLVLERA